MLLFQVKFYGFKLKKKFKDIIELNIEYKILRINFKIRFKSKFKNIFKRLILRISIVAENYG
jgi:hypothetical protein